MKKVFGVSCLVLVLFCAFSAQADIRNYWDPSQIHYAVMAGNQAEVAKLVKEDPKCLNSQQWNRGRTPLMLAAETGNLEITKILLAAGADVTLRSVGGNTALHYAVMEGHTDIAKQLCDYGANPWKLNKRYESPVSLAYYQHNDDLISYWDTTPTMIAK